MYYSSRKHSKRLLVTLVLTLLVSGLILGWMLAQTSLFSSPIPPEARYAPPPKPVSIPDLKPKQPELAESTAPMITMPVATASAQPTEPKPMTVAAATPAEGAQGKENLADGQITTANAPLTQADQPAVVSASEQVKPVSEVAEPAAESALPLPAPTPVAEKPVAPPVTEPVALASAQPSDPIPAPETTPAEAPIPTSPTAPALPEPAQTPAAQVEQMQPITPPVEPAANEPVAAPSTTPAIEALPANTLASIDPAAIAAPDTPPEPAQTMPATPTIVPPIDASPNNGDTNGKTGWIYAGQYQNGTWVLSGLELDEKTLPTSGASYGLTWGANVRSAPPGQRASGDSTKLAENIGYLAEGRQIKVLTVKHSGRQGHIWLEIEY